MPATRVTAMLPLPQVIELYAVPSEFAALSEPGSRRPAALRTEPDLLDPAWAELALQDLAEPATH